MAKIALVTGANKGIGLEVSRQLASTGFTVLLGARDTARGEEAATKLRNEGLDVRFVAADLNDAAMAVRLWPRKLARSSASGRAGQ